ncbi:MAG: N-acetylneuraminate synthase family protein, partial [Planctomycetota bacterium]
MNRVLALVTARGGSKGFPGKNVARLAGRPLVAWAHLILDRLRRTHPELLLHLSTDSAEIAAAWPERDRPRRLRPANLAGDHATSLDVVLHELDAAAAEGKPCAAVLLLQPTSPLLTADDLDPLLNALANGKPSAAVVTNAPHPPQWSLGIAADGTAHQLDPANADRRRQDLPAAYLPCGAWAVRADRLRDSRAFIVPGETVLHVIPTSRAVDIDAPADLAIAHALLAERHRERPFTLGSRRVGGGAPCLLIAEAGVNHDGDPAKAIALVRAAAGAGADAVKFQAFRTDALVTAHANKASYQQSTTGAGDQASMLRKLELNESHFRALKDESERLGLVFLCTPFDDESADMLRRIGVHGFKLGSGELTNHPLLARLAGWGLPLIVSTGMSTLDEVEDAATRISSAGDPPTAWLHCVSQYPAPEAQSNLRAMDSLRLSLGGPVGMSDHSPGHAVTLAAVARGAQVIEKHLTLDRMAPGPDHAASIEPGALSELVRQVRLIESALGDGIKQPAACELDTM